MINLTGIVLLPVGVCTTTVKFPGVGIIEDVIVAVSWTLLITAVVRVAPLKTTAEEETKWLPVAVMVSVGGSCEKATAVGEIELRMGTGRALPQRGFSALHPSRSNSTTSKELTWAIRQVESM
ncbi:MAG TPA: hypothetical protein VI386_20020 [Candidatus Sulfotelmatobacter sp.]